jgi:hypothetical protein
VANSPENNQDELTPRPEAPREMAPKRIINGERNILYDLDQESKAQFKIAPTDKTLSGVQPAIRNGSLLEVNPASFRNEVDLYNAAQRRKQTCVVLGSVIFLLIFIWAISSLFPSNSLETNKRINASETQKFRELYPNAPNPNVPEMTLAMESGSIRTLVGDTTGHRLLLSTPMKMTKIPDCKVVQVGEFSPCLTSTPEAPDTGTLIWLTKDAVRSSLFANAKEFQPVKVTGAPTAAVMTLAGFAPEQRAALVVVSPDSAGYIIILPAQATLADAKKLSTTITVE